MAIFTIIVVDGLIYAAILFLLSVGLTLIFGVLRILNISHGGIYALGAYMATWLALKALGLGVSPYWTYVMLFVGALIIGLVCGPIIERVFVRRVYAEAEAIQLLLTFSILLILDDLIKLIWGTTALLVSTPSTLLGSVSIAGIPYTWYQFVLIGVSVVFGGSLVWLVRGTRFNDREISLAVGINVNRMYTVAFTLGALCAALGGAFIAPTIAVAPGFALEVVVQAFAVIAIGGMGSLEGAALGAFLVGLARALAVHLFAELELVVIYLLMVVVLMIKPEGLFGEVELRRI
jgi:branched-chain amino acid transport system permease protein